MAGLPIRRAQFRTPDFAAWLAKHGAEVGTPTNGYEVIRYRAYHLGGKKAATHIVYAKESGLLTWTGASKLHYAAFAAGMAYAGMFVSQHDSPARAKPTPASKSGPSKAEKLRNRLLMRDGSDCWFCGKALGEDITIEHLVPKSKGGRDGHANYALAHAACNRLAADKPLVEKIELRTQLLTRPHAAAPVAASTAATLPLADNRAAAVVSMESK